MLKLTEKYFRFNFTVNALDGAFFGAALGFASFVTVIPLFVSQFTNSAVLIGLIPAIHAVGWQLPQLFTAAHVSSLSRFKSMVLQMTIHERLPFLGLAFVAWMSPQLNTNTVLLLTFLLLIWQGIGGGLTANAWQSMVAKIIPARILGTFYGVQSSAANLLASLAAILAGILLEGLPYPSDFTICFIIAGLCMGISYLFLAMTREESSFLIPQTQNQSAFWSNTNSILKRDTNFRGFLIARMLSQFAFMSFAFFTVYAVKDFGMSEALVGIMTGILMAIQIIANPVLGWLGDRRGRLLTLKIGTLATIVSVIISGQAQNVLWFYPVFILAGIANVAAWTIPISIVVEFCEESERPAYIGLANTLIAPSTFLAPLVGGWLADQFGFQATFIFSAITGVITLLVLQFAVVDPRKQLKFHLLSITNE